MSAQGEARERYLKGAGDDAQHDISAAIDASARQSIRPYSSHDEYLFAMKEDLSEWLHILHRETINEFSFFRKLETGILLCKHANIVTLHAKEFQSSNPNHPMLSQLKLPDKYVRFNEGTHVKAESFFARDNVAQFISWCRVELGISDTLMFETEDLVLRKNEKNFILTLLEVARRGAKFGMEAPTIIKMEQEIEQEMLLDKQVGKYDGVNGRNFGQNSLDKIQNYNDPGAFGDSTSFERYNQSDKSNNNSSPGKLPRPRFSQKGAQKPAGRKMGLQKGEIQKPQVRRTEFYKPNSVKPGAPKPEVAKPEVQKKAADFKSLDEMVNYYRGQCSCPTMFFLRKVGDGKYQIGDSQALIYMRILRNHVMVRVGGGWDTLENYLNKHDPCRCNRHRAERHLQLKYGQNVTQTLNHTFSPVLSLRSDQLRCSSSHSLGRANQIPSSPLGSLTRTRTGSTSGANAKTIQRPKNSDIDYKGNSSCLERPKFIRSTSNLSRGMNEPFDATFFDRQTFSAGGKRGKLKNDNNNFIVERKKTGHVIRNRSPNKADDKLRVRSASHELSKTLPSFSQRKARDQPKSNTEEKRSQTPSRVYSRPSSSSSLRSNSSTSLPQSKLTSTPNATPRKGYGFGRSPSPFSWAKRLASNEDGANLPSSRESSVDRTMERSYKSAKENVADFEDVEVTLDDLKIGHISRVDKGESAPKTPIISNTTPKVRPRSEPRPGFSRSRIPVPVGSSPATVRRGLSAYSNTNCSPERSDSGIDIYAEFETSPTNSIRRNRQPVVNKPPDITE